MKTICLEESQDVFRSRASGFALTKPYADRAPMWNANKSKRTTTRFWQCSLWICAVVPLVVRLQKRILTPVVIMLPLSTCICIFYLFHPLAILKLIKIVSVGVDDLRDDK